MGCNQDRYIFGGIVVVFLFLRLIALGSDYLWIDNISQLSGGFDHIPWRDVPAMIVKETLASTYALLPMLVYRVALNIWGANIWILQIPAILCSLLSFGIFDRVLAKLFSRPGSRYLPLFLFTLSVPAIIYSRQIHQTIFYFFSTMVQVYFLIGMFQELQPQSALTDIRRKIQIFTRVSILMLLVNWMSMLIYVIGIGSYALVVLLRSLVPLSLGRRIWLVATEVAWESLPLGILAFLRFRMGDALRAYLTPYYPHNFWDYPRLAYDLLSYHFNFAYTPDLYTPLGANLITLPFVLLCLGGVCYFSLKCRWHLAPLVFAVGVTVTAVYFKVLPLGGIRHSFTVAPLLWIFSGYGIEGFYHVSARLKIAGTIVRAGVAALVVVALLTFACSGSKLYALRKEKIDLAALISLADAHKVQTILGYMETYHILAMLNYTAGHIFERQGLDLQLLGEIPYYHSDVTPAPLESRKKYLVVAYRAPLNFQFPQKKATLLLAEIDPVFIEAHVDLSLQSLYFPANGFFVYLLEDEVQPS